MMCLFIAVVCVLHHTYATLLDGDICNQFFVRLFSSSSLPCCLNPISTISAGPDRNFMVVVVGRPSRSVCPHVKAHKADHVPNSLKTALRAAMRPQNRASHHRRVRSMCPYLLWSADRSVAGGLGGLSQHQCSDYGFNYKSLARLIWR